MRQQDHDRRSLKLHRLVAEKIRREPALLGRAAEILAKWRARRGTPSESAPYFEEWQRLIDAGVDACLAVATEDSERATALRQASPLSCLLTQAERLSFLADWYGYQGRERDRWIERIRAAQARAHGVATFEQRYEAIYRVVDARYDIRNPDLSHLVIACLDHDDRIPQDVRDRYTDRVSAGALDYIEACTAALNSSTQSVEGSLYSDDSLPSERGEFPLFKSLTKPFLAYG